jgi:hypothetical protein
MINDQQITVIIYVDDLFFTCINNDLIDSTIILLESVLNCKLKKNIGLIHNYLGMTWDFSTKGKCKVTMEKYINDLLTDNNITDTIDSPASNHLFVINPIAEKLSNDMIINFHTQVAKLLYLAKRIRPDILLPVSFLSTRVQSPDIDDWKKLMRVLKYINGTVNLGITLECDNFIIDSYIDASYGVHSDFKSHTGMIIFLGKGIIDVSSSKQKINTKSSAEAELIAVSDKATKVIWSREFLIHQGYNIPPAIINQDNISTISLV